MIKKAIINLGLFFTVNVYAGQLSYQMDPDMYALYHFERIGAGNDMFYLNEKPNVAGTNIQIIIGGWQLPNGIFGSYPYFNGSNSDIRQGSLYPMNGTGGWTFMFWIKYDGQAAGAYDELLGDGGYDTIPWWCFQTNANKKGASSNIYFTISTVGGREDTNLTLPTNHFFLDQSWHFFAGVRGNNVLGEFNYVFVDGCWYKGGARVVGANMGTSDGLNVGCFNGSSLFFKGCMDELAFFNRALTFGEINKYWSIMRGNYTCSEQ